MIKSSKSALRMYSKKTVWMFLVPMKLVPDNHHCFKARQYKVFSLIVFCDGIFRGHVNLHTEVPVISYLEKSESRNQWKDGQVFSSCPQSMDVSPYPWKSGYKVPGVRPVLQLNLFYTSPWDIAKHPFLFSTYSLCPPFNMLSEMPDNHSQWKPFWWGNFTHSFHCGIITNDYTTSSGERNSMTMSYNTSHEHSDIHNELSTYSLSDCISPAIASLYPPFPTTNDMPHILLLSHLAVTVIDRSCSCIIFSCNIPNSILKIVTRNQFGEEQVDGNSQNFIWKYKY